jgi:glyoxylase-like metal-dependent hydrolase (beta-lactamase superfamily II)
MERLYGTILPCPSDRVRELSDGTSIPFGPRGLEIRHVRGHANHHVIAREPVSGTVFTGDSFGVSYPALNARGPVVIPSTSPTDFDGEEALKSVDLIESMQPSRVALTHYGFIEQEFISDAADQLREGIRLAMQVVSEIRSGAIDPGNAEEVLAARTAVSLNLSDLEVFKIDLKVNAQGLVHAASKA